MLNNTLKIESCIYKYNCRNKLSPYNCVACFFFESHSQIYKKRIESLEAKLGIAVVALCKIACSKCPDCSNVGEKALDDIEKV